MLNPFQCDYMHRLQEWRHLRTAAKPLPLEEVAVEVDRWWQRAPIQNHHLHPADIDNWPDPWTLLSDNQWCTLTRAVGVCYTLLMADINDIELVIATDQTCIDHNLVIVGEPKYVLNYHPDSVLSTCLAEFNIKQHLPVDKLKIKIK